MQIKPVIASASKPAMGNRSVSLSDSVAFIDYMRLDIWIE
jgi:hypothetical protein